MPEDNRIDETHEKQKVEQLPLDKETITDLNVPEADTRELKGGLVVNKITRMC